MVNEAIVSSQVPKLSDVLFERPCRSFASVAVMPSNVEAIEAALMFSAGMISFVGLVGPSGWGKSHLLEAVAYRRSKEFGSPVESMSANEFLTNPGRTDSTSALILDDVQEALSRPRLRMMLRMALERRVKAHRPTLMAFTMPKVTRGLKTLLPAVHDWHLVTIDDPQPAERILLIDQMACAEGLTLSPRLVQIVARQMHGNGRTLAGALKRLRLSGSGWLDGRSTLKACGLLDPFFTDNCDWDLKLRILRAADASRARFSQVSSQDLALYTMLRVAGLAEAEVARASGLEPAEVYLRTTRFDKDVESNPTVGAYVLQFVELIVDTLSTD